MRLFYFLALLVLCHFPAHAAKLALIIDDIGYRHTDNAVLTLPSGVTLSVLPHTQFGKQLAKAGHQKGHEIMLHLPMQTLNGKTLGKGGLTNTMSETELKQTLSSAIASVPFAKGANNHMGSLLTQLEPQMHWLMQGLHQQQLYFVDSRTTLFSKAEQAAQQFGVPVLRRELFLDNQRSPKALETQFTLMIKQAQKQGQFVAIAHTHPETIQFLEANLYRLKNAGIELVPTSALMHQYPLTSVGSNAAKIASNLTQVLK